MQRVPIRTNEQDASRGTSHGLGNVRKDGHAVAIIPVYIYTYYPIQHLDTTYLQLYQLDLVAVVIYDPIAEYSTDLTHAHIHRVRKAP